MDIMLTTSARRLGNDQIYSPTDPLRAALTVRFTRSRATPHQRAIFATLALRTSQFRRLRAFTPSCASTCDDPLAPSLLAHRTCEFRPRRGNGPLFLFAELADDGFERVD